MEQGSKDWFEARKGRVTGSAVGAILELSPFMTPEDVMRRMVREYHGAPSEFNGNVATEYGSFHEAGALQDYEMETGNDVEKCGFYEYSDWLGASPDGLIGDDGLIEIKCPYGKRDENPPKFKSINEQEHYYAQIQIQLLVTDRKWCDFWQWSQHGTMLERVNNDEQWQMANIERLKSFYKMYLGELTNPDHLEDKRIEIESITAGKLLAEYEELTETIERANDRKKDILNQLVELSGGRDSVINGHKLTYVERSGSVSYAKVVKKYLPDLDLKPYTGKASYYWKLT